MSAQPAAPPETATCGQRWTDTRTCQAGPEHRCTRASPDHRSHICACHAVQLRGI
ncbi:hypothetical protein ACFFX1_50910 [Dactylosporangium sucinum]